MADSSSTKNSEPCSIDLDYAALLEDEVFTFIIGKEKKKYKVHVSALKTISEPLGYMMTNGEMEESLKREAVLDDIEPETFVQLARFAYKGLCTVADGVKCLLPGRFQCHCCGGLGNTTEYPFCSTSCKADYSNRLSELNIGWSDYSVYCVWYSCGDPFSLSRTSELLCNKHHTSDAAEQYPSVDANLQPVSKKETNRSSSFNYRQYGCTEMSHKALSNHIEVHLKGDHSAWPLVQHAKLYVLAQKYMVRDLKEICLHKLHRNLTRLEINEASTEEIIDLLLYTYQHTEDGGDIVNGTADKLRDLVMAYVADHSKQLTAYNSFSEAIGVGGTHTTDFIKLICRSKNQ